MKYLQLAKKYRYYILGSALLIVLAIGYIWANSVTAKQEEKEILETNEVAQVEPEIEKIKVEIKGQVKKPNVYELDASARVIDLINKAGGLTKEANTNNINL